MIARHRTKSDGAFELLPPELLYIIGENFEQLDVLILSHVNSGFRYWASCLAVNKEPLSIYKLLFRCASIGSGNLFQYLVELREPLHLITLVEELACVAAFRGNLNILVHLAENLTLHEIRSASKFALIGAQRPCLEYLDGLCGEENEFCSEEVDLQDTDQFSPLLKMAVVCGMRDAVESLLAMGAAGLFSLGDYCTAETPDTQHSLCAYASSMGDVDMLKYLHGRGFPCAGNAASAAVLAGNSNCLRYLIESGCLQEKDEGLEQDAIHGGDQACIDMVLALPPNFVYRNYYGDEFDEADIDDFDNEDEDSGSEDDVSKILKGEFCACE